MPDRSTILVPIRYPLTDQSSQTLAAAGRLAQERSPSELYVLHVNLVHHNGSVKTTEITQAISSVLDEVDASVITRRGFLVEEVILEEANNLGADLIITGTDRDTRWRRILRRLSGNDPNISEYLHSNIPSSTEVVEVDDVSSPPKAEAAP